jgi:hypothetical protein
MPIRKGLIKLSIIFPDLRRNQVSKATMMKKVPGETAMA